MFDPQKPMIQINIYLESLPLYYMAWLFSLEIMEFLLSTEGQVPFLT